MLAALTNPPGCPRPTTWHDTHSVSVSTACFTSVSKAWACVVKVQVSCSSSWQTPQASLPLYPFLRSSMGTGAPTSFAMRMRSRGPSDSPRQPRTRARMRPSTSIRKISGTPPNTPKSAWMLPSSSKTTGKKSSSSSWSCWRTECVRPEVSTPTSFGRRPSGRVARFSFRKASASWQCGQVCRKKISTTVRPRWAARSKGTRESSIAARKVGASGWAAPPSVASVSSSGRRRAWRRLASTTRTAWGSSAASWPKPKITKPSASTPIIAIGARRPMRRAIVALESSSTAYAMPCSRTKSSAVCLSEPVATPRIAKLCLARRLAMRFTASLTMAASLTSGLKK